MFAVRRVSIPSPHLAPSVMPRKYSAEECRDMLKNPSESVVNATKRIVAQMANGGLELPKEWQSPQEREGTINAAKGILINLFNELEETRTFKTYHLGKQVKAVSLPGKIVSSKKTDSKQENFIAAVKDYPFLFHISGSDVTKLDLDVRKMESLLDKYGLGII